ncbi:hypothetical protein AVEN_11023-1 [Araneus ventricosus]|uniref:Gustatory receptor n=1 Tax=Araneus ventricosus TaxID=182803 RepID=A0A4Y2RXS5_ARAVE|nr:hypothetical protein AVEN_11023-1 [Araneus ventricosus]
MFLPKSSLVQIDKITEHLPLTEIGKTFLWSYLGFTGISVRGDFSKRSCIYESFRFWFPFVIHVSLLSSLVQIVFGYMSGMWSINVIIASASGNILSVVLWHVLYHKRKPLREFLVKVQELNCSLLHSYEKHIEAVLINLSLLCNTAIPIAFALLCICSSSTESRDTFWTYGYKMEDLSTLTKSCIFVAIIAYNSLKIFPGILTCIYCVLCIRLSKLLISYNEKLVKIAEGSLHSSPKRLVNQYFEILSTVELLQIIFSEPLFVLILRHFLHLFATLAYVMPFLKQQFTTVIIGEITVIVLTTCLSTIAIMIFASKITDNIQNVKHSFQRYKEKMVLEHEGKDEKIIQLAIDRDYVQPSACNTIILRKRFILSIFGALLTYSIIIFQIM